jgi:hypothetical protein
MLPNGYCTVKAKPYKTSSVQWQVYKQVTPHIQIADTEADAHAKLLIYLVENNFFTLQGEREYNRAERRF